MNDTAPSALTVFRTQLPYVDRRSLSEAWFSALHLAGDGTPKGGRAVSAGCGARPFAAATSHAGPASAPYRAPGESATATSRRYAAALRPGVSAAGAGPSAGVSSASSARDRATRGDGSSTVDVPVPAAGRVRRYAERRTSLTLGVEGSRVQLLLRREGPVLHVVALCRADVADAVRLALALAGGQLRLAGDSLRASVQVRP